jgi:YVTN family beta-propeller protein
MAKPNPNDFRVLPPNDEDLIPLYIGSDVSKPFWIKWGVVRQILTPILPSGAAAWGSIATGTGVASQTDLVAYLNANYIDPTELAAALSNYVPTSRTLTINGFTYDLSADRSWTISGGGAVDSVNGQTGVVVLELNDIDDVNAPSPTVGQVLQWNGTEWVAATISGSGTVTSVNSGININVDNTDPANPIVNSLSDRYKTTSTTSNSVSNGSKNFTVDLNLSYISLQEILVVYDASNHMHGEVTSYNSSTGALVVDIKNHTGSGTYTAWVLNLDGTPVDALSGSGTTNEIAYFTGARVLASLPVATYPSLTELSYVKGVTSSIQDQLDENQTAIYPYITNYYLGSANSLNILIEPSIDRLYIPANSTGEIKVYEASTGVLIATITLASVASCFYVNSELWATNTASGTIARYNATTGVFIANITGSGTRGTSAYQYSSTKVFITNLTSNNVTVVNPTTNAVHATISSASLGGNGAFALAYNNNSSSSHFGYIAVILSTVNEICLIDPATNTVVTAGVNPSSSLNDPRGIVYDSSTDRYYVINANGQTVSVIQPSGTGFVLDTLINNIQRGFGIVQDTTTNLIYTTGSNLEGSVLGNQMLYTISPASKSVIKVTSTSVRNTTTTHVNNISIDNTNGFIYTNTYGGTLNTNIAVKLKLRP